MASGTSIRNIAVAAVRTVSATNSPPGPVLHHPGTVSVPVSITRIRPRPAIGLAETVPVAMSIMSLQRRVLAVVDTDLSTVYGAITAKFNPP